MSCCLLSRIVSRLAISGISITISRLKTRAPGEVYSVALTAHRSACIAVANALSIIWFAVLMSFGGLVCNMTRKISPTV